MNFIQRTCLKIMKMQYGFLSKAYQLHNALYFVEPHDIFILNQKDNFFSLVEDKNKNACFNILFNIEKYCNEKIEEQKNIILKNKKMTFIEKEQISFYLDKIKIINMIKMILKLFF